MAIQGIAGFASGLGSMTGITKKSAVRFGAAYAVHEGISSAKGTADKAKSLRDRRK